MLKKNLVYSGVHVVVQFIFPLITFPYASRILGPHGIGSVNFIDSFTQYFLLFAALGIPVYGIREIAKLKFKKNEMSKMFSEIFFIHLFSTIFFSVIYLILGFSIPALRSHFELIIIGVAIMLLNVAMFEWFFIGIEELAYLVKRMLVVRILSIIIMFVLLNYFPQSFYYYLVFAIVSFLCGLSNLLVIRKHIHFTCKNLEFKKHFKSLIIILGATLAASAYVLLDTVILGFIKGEEAVGFYATAVRIVRLPFAFIGAISAIMIPLVSRAYNEGDLNQVNSLLNKSFTFICVIGFPIAIGLAVSASFVVTTFAGKNFSNTILVLQMLTPVILLVGINSILGTQLLTPIGKERQVLISVVIGMVFSLIMNLILIPRLSYYGAAITNVATEIVVTLLCFYFSRNFLVIKLDKKILLQSFLGAAAFVPISMLIKGLHLSKNVMGLSVIITCMVFYVAYFWFVVKNIYVQNMKVEMIKKFSSVFNSNQNV